LRESRERGGRPGHHPAWAFTSEMPAGLIELLAEGPVAIGQPSYKFSGPEEKPRLFVSRAPVKE